MSWQIIEGDARVVCASLPEQSVHTCVTSPPYYGLRDYGSGGQIGLEATPDEYVAALVEVFREVRRVLRDDGTVWLNLGDSYNAYNGGAGPGSKLSKTQTEQRPQLATGYGLQVKSMKPKDLLGIPWMVAFAMRADGWYLRSDIIWAKPNPMPESVTDRPTKAHEYMFLLSKGPRYFYDHRAIREQDGGKPSGNGFVREHRLSYGGRGQTEQWVPAKDRNVREPGAMPRDDAGRPGPTGEQHTYQHPDGRNKRSVWTVATQPYAGAHFATFPPKLIEPCILAGSPPKCCGECGAPWRRVVERTAMVVRASERSVEQGDDVNDRRTATSGTMTEPPTSRTVGWQPTCECVPLREDDNGWSLMLAEENAVPSKVLDPFAGSGTTGMVALRHNRSFIGIELNPAYAQLARDRIVADCPLHNTGLEIAA